MKKNIAIIISKLTGGGAERVASNLSIELSETYKVKLIVFDGTERTYPYKGDIFDLGLAAETNPIKKVINVIKKIKYIRKIKKDENIVTSISLLTGPNLVNVLSASGEKVITSVRNFTSKKKMSFLQKKIFNYTMTKSDKIVALSKMVKEDLVQNFSVNSEKITVIYNSCDSNRLKKLAYSTPINYNFNEQNQYIVTVGRHTKQKGQWHLLRAFKKVLVDLPNTKLLILGKGELTEKLQNLARELKIDKNVEFLGYIENPHYLIHKSEVFAFSSLYEGLGNALLESLAMSTTIVSTDCKAGPREILAPGSDFRKQTNEIEFGDYGVLVPVGNEKHFNPYDALTSDEEYLSRAIISVLKNEKMRRYYEEKSNERIKYFSPEKINKQWSELI